MIWLWKMVIDGEREGGLRIDLLPWKKREPLTVVIVGHPQTLRANEWE